jgi:carbonic anhydrase
MSAIDDVLRANQAYAAEFSLADLHHHPSRKLAVVACMDCRINVEHALGLQSGEAHILRNAGGIVTEDTLRSLIVSHHLLGTREVMVINHTRCGMMAAHDDEIRAHVRRHTGVESDTPVHFHTFSDLEENVRLQVRKVVTHPWIPSHVVVRGFVYDVGTGRLHEVEAMQETAA